MRSAQLLGGCHGADKLGQVAVIGGVKVALGEDLGPAQVDWILQHIAGLRLRHLARGPDQQIRAPFHLQQARFVGRAQVRKVRERLEENGEVHGVDEEEVELQLLLRMLRGRSPVD